MFLINSLPRLTSSLLPVSSHNIYASSSNFNEHLWLHNSYVLNLVSNQQCITVWLNIFDDWSLTYSFNESHTLCNPVNYLNTVQYFCRSLQLIKLIVNYHYQSFQLFRESLMTNSENCRFLGKIKSRSLAIFATGDNMKVVTVTANNGFIRAAAGQGVTFATVTHESRALTEDKEKTAKDLTSTTLDL